MMDDQIPPHVANEALTRVLEAKPLSHMNAGVRDGEQALQACSKANALVAWILISAKLRWVR